MRIYGGRMMLSNMGREAEWAIAVAALVADEQLLVAAPIRTNEANQAFRLQFASRTLFLKVGPALHAEYERLRWLHGRLRAPEPIGFSSENGTDALLMSCLQGEDLARLSTNLPARVIIRRLSAALRSLHSAQTHRWPFGGSGVLIHGDACLPNFLFEGERLTGYVDVGEMRLGDPEVDLAAAVWSLQYNLGPGFGLEFLKQYGVADADENYVERLRAAYEAREN